MKLIIPMSGEGRRFVEAGYEVPKPLIMVDGKPMVQHVVEMFPGTNGQDVIFICNERHICDTSMRDVLTSVAPGCKIVVIPEHKLGPVYAIYEAQDAVPDDEDVIVSYCDYGTLWDFEAFRHMLDEIEPDGAVAAYVGFHPHMLGKDHYAYMLHDGDMWMTDIQEKKPFGEDKMKEYASNGTYYFKSGKLLKSYCERMLSDERYKVNGEYYVSMLYKLLIEDGHRIRIFEIEKMLQWGTPYDLDVYNMWSGFFTRRHEVPLVTSGSYMRDAYTTLLPMAGRGSRFAMKGFNTPKPFLPVEGKPMVVRALESLPETRDIVLVTLDEHLRDHGSYFEDIKDGRQSILIHSIPDVTDGQATTCMVAIDQLGLDMNKGLMISACDNGAYYDVNKHRCLVESGEADVIVWAFHNNPTSKLYPHMYAWLDVDEDMNIKRVSIKKPFNDCENKYAIIGTMLFRTGHIFKEGYQYIIQHDLKTNGEYYVDNVLEPLIEKGYKVKMFPVDYYLCWGTPEDYKTYNYWSEALPM